MKVLLALVSLAAFITVGCAHKQKGLFQTVPDAPASPMGSDVGQRASTAAPAASSPDLIVTPGSGLTGKVARYNEAGRFVVLEFPVGRLPSLDQRLFVYRGGLKVGELKVTGPQRDDHIVADLTTGEARSGDEVRDK